MRLKDLIGGEHRLEEVSRAVREAAEGLRAPVVGAHQIACSDESEKECVRTFHTEVVRKLLPELKFWSRSAFRTTNLGGRYERGSLPIAEDHYATPASREAFKLMIVKINSHVSMVRDQDGPIYGRKDRYDQESVYCGALHALLEGGRHPCFLEELEATFGADGVDRLSLLQDHGRVEPRERALLAAIVNARLQLRMAVADALAHPPETPTYYLMLTAVTINRTDDDTELPVGLHLIDGRGESRSEEYLGLGDKPTLYRLSFDAGRVRVTDRILKRARM